MKLSTVPLSAAAWMIFASVSSHAGDVKVIANLNVRADTISPAELKHVFLEEKNSFDGAHVEPVLAKGGTSHATFVKDYLGKSEDDLQTYYRALVFTGRGSMPKALGSDQEVVAYVARTRGAIGYVDSEASALGVKTLLIEDVSNGGQRNLITRVEPDYPETLKRLNIGGTVRLRVSISAKGNVDSVEVLGGNPILGESAAIAVKHWVYAAGKTRSIADVSVPFDVH